MYVFKFFQVRLTLASCLKSFFEKERQENEYLFLLWQHSYRCFYETNSTRYLEIEIGLFELSGNIVLNPHCGQ